MAGKNLSVGDLGDAETTFPIRTIYFETPTVFPEINSFTYETASMYDLSLSPETRSPLLSVYLFPLSIYLYLLMLFSPLLFCACFLLSVNFMEVKIGSINFH